MSEEQRKRHVLIVLG
jgi:hypothetical protein